MARNGLFSNQLGRIPYAGWEWTRMRAAFVPVIWMATWGTWKPWALEIKGGYLVEKANGLPSLADLSGLAGDNWTADVLLEHMGRDKKTQDGKLTFILARAIGNSFVANDIDRETVRAVLDASIEDAR